MHGQWGDSTGTPGNGTSAKPVKQFDAQDLHGMREIMTLWLPY